MLKVCLPTLIALSLFLSDQVHSQEIQWIRSATEAAQVAQQTGKPILVYVRSASCGYCDLLQRKVWEDSQAASTISRDFVALKLTREENAEQLEALKIKGFPATFVFSADRQFVHRIDGYLERNKFMSELDQAHRAARPDGIPARLSSFSK